MGIAIDLFSTTVVVEDQDRALAFYRDVLGCEVRLDLEFAPGARIVEVAPPGARVPVVLLTRDGGLPLGVRYLTADADEAHRALREAGREPHTEVLHLDGAPPMFTVDDPDGNTVIVMQAQGSGLPATDVLAAVPVSDPEAAAEFYGRLFGRLPDAAPMPGLSEWRLGEGGRAGTFQAVVDAERAGGGLVTVVLPDLAAAVAAARERGVELEASDAEVVTAFARVLDPDGNAITLVQA